MTHQKPQWQSHEMKVVYSPPRYAFSDERRPGMWATFSLDGAVAGVLEGDGVSTLTFEGRGGHTDLSVSANGLIMQFAAFGYSAQTAFALVKGLLELEVDGLTSTLVYGQLPRPREDRR